MFCAWFHPVGFVVDYLVPECAGSFTNNNTVDLVRFSELNDKMQGTGADVALREGSLREDLYYGKQIIKEKVDVKIDQIGLKYVRAAAAIRNFLRFYGFITYIKYDGSPESFQLLV